MIKRHLWLIWLFWPSVLTAQQINYNFNSYTTENGLPTNSVSHVIVDSYGFLWLATFEGLYRWDGYTFKQYVHEDTNARTLDNNIIYSIYEDSHKRLWVGTIGGLNLYDRALDVFVRHEIKPGDKQVPVNAIKEDKLHQLWLASSDGLCLYNPATKRSAWFNDQPTDLVFCMDVDANNDLWVGTFNNGLKKFVQATRHFISFGQDRNNPRSMPDNKIRSILCANDGTIWVATEDHGIVILSVSGTLVRKIDPLSGSGANYFLYQDKNNTIWIGQNKEVISYMQPGDSLPVTLATTCLNNNHAKLSAILSICEDQFGNTWFASTKHGLFSTNTNKNLFSNYLFDPGFEKVIGSPEITSFYQDRTGKIWVGTKGKGILQFDPYSSGIKPVIPELAADYIYDIHDGKDGNLWIGSFGRGLLKFDPVSGKLIAYKHDPANQRSLIFNDMKSLLPDDSVIWVGTFGEGLAALNLKTNQFTDHKSNRQFSTILKQTGWINHVFKDSRNRLWIASYSGLFVYDRNKFTHFEHTAEMSSISSNSVNMVAEDKTGRIWLVSEAGLDLYDEGTAHFTRYGGQNKLPGSMKSIVFDHKGLLWIGSNNGIFSFDPGTKAVKQYDIQDGLSTNSFCLKAALCTREGKLYFGTPNGFCAFDPARLTGPAIPAYFYFTDLYLNNKQQQPGAAGSPIKKVLAFSDSIEITPKQSFFSVEFESVNLYAPAKIKYSYKLEGLNDQWIDADMDRKVFFMNLRPADYLLKVRYTDMNGKWIEASKYLLIKVLPAVWQTWWFKLLMIALVLIAIVSFFYLRVASIRKRNNFLTKEVERRTNELNIMNTSLIEQNDEIKAQKETLEVSNEEIRRQADKILTQQQYIMDQNQELEKTVEELQTLNGTKDHFFSILAHDLKNPVSALTEITGFIQENFQQISKKELEEYIEGVHKSSASVYDLLVNLLNWSRTQANQMKAKPTVWNFAELVEKNRRLLEPQLRKKLISFQSHVNPVHWVNADFDMIDAVIRNVIHNSIKFTGYNGRIEVFSAEKDSSIILRITDSGTGMRPEQLEGLFRIDKTIVSVGTAGEKGTGLGLVISKEFVEKNDGTIWVESTAGKGCSFYVQLPAGIPTSNPAEATLNVKRPYYSKLSLDLWDTLPVEKLMKIKGKKILIADDNVEVRNYLKIIISDTFELFEAANGKEALKLATEIVPVVVITDVLMPDMNGLEFCRILKSQTATSHIPVIMLTSQWEESMQVSGYEAGTDVYLTKPVKKDLLLQVILNLIQGQERLRERIFELLLSDQSFQPAASSINKLDESFLNRLIGVIEKNMADTNLDAKLICREMATSRTVLYAKLKTLTGQSVHEFIKTIRLRKSIRLLLEGNLTVSQVAYEVGFSSHSYFDKCFIKQYKMGPREYINRKKGKVT